MLLGLFVFALAGLLACTAAGSAGGTTLGRETGRRERYLRDHPDRVNALDVERLLRGSLPAETVADLGRRAEALRLPSMTSWRWIQAHGDASFSLVVRAGVGAGALNRHLSEGTTPDVSSLELFARLNAGPVEALVRHSGLDEVLPESATLLPRRELRRFRSLPPIMEPGLSPYAG